MSSPGDSSPTPMSTDTDISAQYSDSPNARSYSAARSRAHTRVACTTCKAAKVRCEGARPCRYCVKHQLSDQCVDAIQKKRGPKPKTIKLTGLTFDLSRANKAAAAAAAAAAVVLPASSARRSPPASKRAAVSVHTHSDSHSHHHHHHVDEPSRSALVPGAPSATSPPGTNNNSPLSRHAPPTGYSMDHGVSLPVGAYAALPPTPPSQIPLYPMGLPFPGMPFSMPIGLSSPAASSSHQRGEGGKAESFGMPFPPSPTLFLNGMHVPMGMSLPSMAGMTGGDKQNLSPSFAVPPYPMLYGTPPMAAAGGRFMFDMPITPTFAASQSAYGLGGFCYYPQPPMTALPASVVSLLPPTAPSSTSGSSTPLSAGDGTATSSSGRRLSVASMDSGVSKDSSTPNMRFSKPTVSPRAHLVSPRTTVSPRTASSPAHSHLLGQDVPFPAPNSPIFDAVEGLTAIGRRRSHSVSEAASAPEVSTPPGPTGPAASGSSPEPEDGEPSSGKSSPLASRPMGSSSSAFGRPQKRIRS